MEVEVLMDVVERQEALETTGEENKKKFGGEKELTTE